MKYNSERDKILDWMSTGGWANRSDGDVSNYGLHFAIISNDETDRDGVEDAFGEDMAACEPPVMFEDLIGTFMVFEDEDGFVSVVQYKDDAEGKADFKQHQKHYSEWLSEEDEESERVTDDPDLPAGTLIINSGVYARVEFVQGDRAYYTFVGDDREHFAHRDDVVDLKVPDQGIDICPCGQVSCAANLS